MVVGPKRFGLGLFSVNQLFLLIQSTFCLNLISGIGLGEGAPKKITEYQNSS